MSLTLSPTPHPLATVVGALLSLLGDAAQPAWVVLAFLALGALAWLTLRARRALVRPGGGRRSRRLVILTRIPVLSFGVRAYVDIPYVALVLGAILAEARRRRAAPPRRGTPPRRRAARSPPPRPAAARSRSSCSPSPASCGPRRGCISLAYVAWRRDLRLLPLALSAPVLWALHDLVLAGNPLHSFTYTSDNADTLQRITGLDDVPLTVPRRIGEILREPGLFGAVAGGLLVLAFMRRRAALLLAAGVVSLGAFCVLAAAGLPILGRYLLLPAAILAVFCGAGVFGWTRLPADHPWRTRWAAIGALILVVFAVFAPGQAKRVSDLRRSMHTQAEILADLHAISDEIPCRAGRGAQPPADPARRAVDRHPAARHRVRAALAADVAAPTSTRRASACCATSRSTRATRSA